MNVCEILCSFRHMCVLQLFLKKRAYVPFSFYSLTLLTRLLRKMFPNQC